MAVYLRLQKEVSKCICLFLPYPVQSLNLQILEKWGQKFDGMVGQDDGQNSKSLVSLERKPKKTNTIYKWANKLTLYRLNFRDFIAVTTTTTLYWLISYSL